MTRPQPFPDDPGRAELRFEPGMDAWSFTAVPAGPAGVLSVLLGNEVRLSVDAVPPHRFVELAVHADGGVPGPAGLRWVKTLLGGAAAGALVDSDPAADRRLVTVHPSAALGSAAALAVALHLARPPHGHPLRRLDVLLAAQQVGDEALRLASAAAWQAWPAVTSLARATSPMVPPAVPVDALEALRVRLVVLLDLVRSDDPTVAASAAHRLVTDLVARLARHRPDPLAGVDVEDAFAALVSSGGLLGDGADGLDDVEVLDLDLELDRAVTLKGPGPAGRVEWTGDVADFRIRLGELGALLHRGQVTATGTSPGPVVVSVPVALGTRTEDLAGVEVRLLTGDGELVARGGLEIEDEPDALPRATAVLQLGDRLGGRSAGTVVVDLAPRAMPAPDAEDLRRWARLKAVRSGQDAVAAAVAGDAVASAALWQECADALASCGQRDLADRAEHYAREAREQSAQRPQDWLVGLLDGWQRWAAERRDDARRAAAADGSGATEQRSAVQQLREVIDRLTGWNDRSAELARARADLGAALRAAPAEAVEPDEADYQLREAMRLFYDLGMDVEALACLRALGRHRAT